MLCALFWPCFSPRTLYFLVLRTLLRMSLIFQRSFPTPLSSPPKKCPPTPSINTQFGFFHSSPHLNQSSHPSHYCRTNQLFLTSFDGHLFGPVQLASQTGRKMRGFIGEIYPDKKATWMQSESQSSASPSPGK